MKIKVSSKTSGMPKNGSKTRAKNSRSKTESKTKRSRALARGGAKATKNVKNEKLTDFVVSLMDRTKSSGIGDSNNLTVDDIFRLLDLYFYRDFYTTSLPEASISANLDPTANNCKFALRQVFSECSGTTRISFVTMLSAVTAIMLLVTKCW